MSDARVWCYAILVVHARNEGFECVDSTVISVAGLNVVLIVVSIVVSVDLIASLNVVLIVSFVISIVVLIVLVAILNVVSFVVLFVVLIVIIAVLNVLLIGVSFVVLIVSVIVVYVYLCCRLILLFYARITPMHICAASLTKKKDIHNIGGGRSGGARNVT